MSFPDVTRILAEFIMERGICEAGIILEDGATFPFALLRPLPGEQSSDGLFRTDVIAVELTADSDWSVGKSAREIALETYAAIEDAVLEGPIWSPRGLIDGCEIHETENDDNLSVERDVYVFRFSILVESRCN